MNSLQFENSYSQLPEQFYSAQLPTPVPASKSIRLNRGLAKLLQIDAGWLGSEGALQTFSGNHILPGSEPIASVYAGHQFGGWNPQLGDGRAILLGEVIAEDGHRYDIQLKGSGRTPYSRNGDGRSPLGPVLREYILSEAMHALGVPTTRSLAAVTTGDTVYRETPLPGAILTRVAFSHIRIGTFQYFSAKGDTESVRLLYEYCAKRHSPETLDAESPVLAFLDAVIEKQAALIAKWQLLGFIHGVMNTDNMLICGETVDYGPCAFMDAFDPNAVFSSIDHQGRYRYANQPKIAHWNLSWLAQSLIPLMHENQEKATQLAQQGIDQFSEKYHQLYNQGMAHKLGFAYPCAETIALADRLFDLMAESSVDFTLCFRKLADISVPGAEGEIPDDLFRFPESFDSWLEDWKTLLDAREPELTARVSRMRSANPRYIPRNHLVEEAIDAAQNNNDFEPFHKLVDLLSVPFGDALGEKDLETKDLENEKFLRPPNPTQMVHQTFCGT